MAKIIGGVAAGKQINCKCSICSKKFSFTGENYIKHDQLYNDMKKNGLAKEHCEECKELISYE